MKNKLTITNIVSSVFDILMLVTGVLCIIILMVTETPLEAVKAGAYAIMCLLHSIYTDIIAEVRKKGR